jgi:hypothetical protein
VEIIYKALYLPKRQFQDLNEWIDLRPYPFEEAQVRVWGTPPSGAGAVREVGPEIAAVIQQRFELRRVGGGFPGEYIPKRS